MKQNLHIDYLHRWSRCMVQEFVNRIPVRLLSWCGLRSLPWWLEVMMGRNPFTSEGPSDGENSQAKDLRYLWPRSTASCCFPGWKFSWGLFLEDVEIYDARPPEEFKRTQILIDDYGRPASQTQRRVCWTCWQRQPCTVLRGRSLSWIRSDPLRPRKDSSFLAAFAKPSWTRGLVWDFLRV